MSQGDVPIIPDQADAPIDAELAKELSQNARDAQVRKAERIAAEKAQQRLVALQAEQARLERAKAFANQQKTLQEKDDEIARLRGLDGGMTSVMQSSYRDMDDIVDDLHATKRLLDELGTLTTLEYERYQRELKAHEEFKRRWQAEHAGKPFVERGIIPKHLTGAAAEVLQFLGKTGALDEYTPAPMDKDLALRHQRLHYRLKRLQDELSNHPESDTIIHAWTEEVDEVRAERGIAEDPPKPPRPIRSRTG